MPASGAIWLGRSRPPRSPQGSFAPPPAAHAPLPRRAATLENHLGLSQGYPSRLKAGAGTPSPALVLLLQLLALDPISRLREMERIWGEPILTDSPNGTAISADSLGTKPPRSMPPFT